jgi:N-acetylglucosamine-6-sulfatase
VVAGLVVVGLAGVGIQDHGLASSEHDLGQLIGTSNEDPPDATLERPNVILIIADDLDDETMKYMPHVRHLIKDDGATFPNFYVEQSSCCTSRASILSGLYAHNHGVIGNAWPQGGYDRWRLTKQNVDLATWLQRDHYRSALMGKYMNEYPFHATIKASKPAKARLRDYVPPGWQDWAVPVQGNAYAQDHYKLNINGHMDQDFRSQFLDSYLGNRMVSLIHGADGFDFAKGNQFVYYASYSPHTPYAYPKSYADKFDDIHYPRLPDFDEADVSDKFGFTRTRPLLTQAYINKIDETFRKRVRSVQTLDQNVARIVAALKAEGTLDNTYIMFTSDNGYIMGGHRREIGKYNQFRETVQVPFYVRGPGIKPGSVFHDVAGNIDIAPTIAAITGAKPPYTPDGVSLLDRLRGGPPLSRKYYLLGRALAPTNDKAEAPIDEAPESFVESSRSSRLNDFTGVVSNHFKLIKYTHLPHEELYDLQTDPWELHNLLDHDQASYDAMSAKAQRIVDTLRAELARLDDCAGVTCQ